MEDYRLNKRTLRNARISFSVLYEIKADPPNLNIILYRNGYVSENVVYEYM